MILVEMGNAHPQELFYDPETMEQSRRDLPGPCVTYTSIPDDPAGPAEGLEWEEGETFEAFLARHEAHVQAHWDRYGKIPAYSFPDEHDDALLNDEIATTLGRIHEADARVAVRRLALIAHMAARPDGVTHLPNHSAFVAIAHPVQGAWANTSAAGTRPTWVWSSHPALQKFLAEFYECPEGRPSNLEDTHVTQYGKTVYPPGASPPPDAVALHTNIGRDGQAIQQFGFGYLGTVGTATATSSTSLTGSAETGVSHASNDCAGQAIYAGANSGGTGSTVYGLITANTSGATPTYTVDRWYAAASPGGAVGTTPNSTAQYQVVSGGPPTMFVGLTANSTTPAATDTTLPAEITTVGGGLIRKIAPVTHSAGATTVVLTPVFTANGSDSLPVTIAKAGASNSMVSTSNNQYQTLVSPTATLNLSGDQLTITWTFTMT